MIIEEHTGQHFALVGVYGHIRFNTTEYHLYLIKCDVDIEFLDTLKIANDPELQKIVKKLQMNQISSKSSQFWTSLYDWVVWILVTSLELGVEIFL